MPWDVDRYADRLTPRNSGRNAVFEEELASRYPPMYVPPKTVAYPLLVTDRHNNAILWYLPKMLTARRHVS
jgi:hypothetical protein